MVGEGLRSKEIARNLGISPRTVDAHIANAVATMQVRSRLDAAMALRDRDPSVVLPSQPAPLADGGSVAAAIPPDRSSRTWWHRLPILRNGRLANDLTVAHRLAWMLIGAVAIIFVFAQLANGLSVVQSIAIGLNR